MLLGPVSPPVMNVLCVEQWLQDVISLQCSIMRHLSIKQKAGSAESSAELDSKKTSVSSEDMKLQASLERTSSELCFKPCALPLNPQGPLTSRDPPAELGVCKCSLEPCQNCRKPNGPLAELQLTEANGPVDCKTSDSYRQAELQLRLKPCSTPPDSVPTPELPNHIGTQTVKKDPESTAEDCAQKNCPMGPTIWPPRSQQNHRSQAELQEECTSRDEKPTSLTSTSTSPSGTQVQDPTKQELSFPSTGTVSGHAARCCVH